MGYYFPYWVNSFEFIPQLFTNGLKLILVPLIVTSIISAVTQLSGSVRSAGAIARSFIYFVSTTAMAVITGIILVILFNTGATGIDRGGQFPDELSALVNEPLSSLLQNLIPTSFPEAILMGNYPAIILIAIILAVALSLSGRSAKVLIDLNKSAYDLVYKIIEFIMVALPVTLFLMSASLFSQNHYDFPEILTNVSSFFMVLLIGLVIHALFLLPLILKKLGKQSPLEYFKGLLPALSTAFATGSSITTLPITTECAITNCHGNKNAAALVIPIGSVFNLNATAMFAVIATLTAANMYSIELSIGTILLLISGAVLASFGISGITYGSLILTTILFGIAELPTAAYGFIGILFLADWFSSRLLAVVNIWSDVTGSAVISEFIEPQKKPRKTSRVSSRSTGRTTSRSDSYSRSKRSSSRERKPSSSSYKSRTERSPRTDKDKRYSRERSDSYKRSEDKRKPSGSSESSSKYMRPERSSSTRTSKIKDEKAFEIYSEKEMPIDLDAPVPKTITPKSRTKSTPKSKPKSKPKNTFDITAPPSSLPTMKDSAPPLEKFDKPSEIKARPLKSETKKPEPLKSNKESVSKDEPETKFGRRSRTPASAKQEEGSTEQTKQKDAPVSEKAAEKSETKEEKPLTYGRVRKKRP